MLLALCVLLSLVFPLAVAAAPGSTVYVRKHVSILYDNSGSMKNGRENLKWCYASYAAQMFTGLLNDTDTLSISFMDGTQLQDIDLEGLRQNAVSAVLEETSTANADTPIGEISTALQVLKDEGLEAGLGTNDAGEQFWLVLTTDGVFREYGENLSAERVATEIGAIMTTYPDLHVVYFGIGTLNDDSDSKAVDFRAGSDVPASILNTLHSYPNFTAVYAESQEQIVETMQTLSNQISGRYSVSEEFEVSGNQVKLYLSGEGSPIRNIAVLNQETNAKLLSATADDGTELTINREAEIRYPRNSSYSNVPEDTLGGYVALITGPGGGKVPNGTILLTYSEPVSKENLALMYEPAIHVRLQVERKTDSGEWVALPSNADLVEGEEIRATYAICEDGTDKELDTEKLFGKTEVRILYNGEELGANETVVVELGESVLDIRVSMMDGGYQISTSRTIRVTRLNAGDLKVDSSGPIEMYRSEAATNTAKFVEFAVSFRELPADAAQMSKVSLQVTGDAGALAGETAQPQPHIFRFTPRDGNCVAGTYTVHLFYEDTEIATEEILIRPNETSFTAEAGSGISIMGNRVGDNTDSVIFTVTAHRDAGDGPITAVEAELFQITAESNGANVRGYTDWQEGGILSFTLQDSNAAVGTYDVKLRKGDEVLAQTHISVLHYDAHYTVETVLTDPNSVDRFDLDENSSGIYFIVYEDGVPCSATQLEAMLNRQLLVSTDLSSPFAELDVSVAGVNGKAALFCAPKSSTNSSIIRYFHRVLTSIGIGGLARDSFQISLKVDMLHGTEAAGELDLVGYDLVPLISLIIILVILTLIAMFVLANLRAVRLRPGILWSFEASAGIAGYNIALTSEKKVGMGIRLMLFPADEKLYFSGLKFYANGANNRKKWLRATSPTAYIAGTPNELSHYFYQTPMDVRTELLNAIKNGELLQLPGHRFNILVAAAAAVLPPDGLLKPEERIEKTVSLMDGAILYKVIGQHPTRYQFWCYSVSANH